MGPSWQRESFMGGTVGRSRSPSIENRDGDECGREYEHNLGDGDDWHTVENDDEHGDEHNFNLILMQAIDAKVSGLSGS